MYFFYPDNLAKTSLCRGFYLPLILIPLLFNKVFQFLKIARLEIIVKKY